MAVGYLQNLVVGMIIVSLAKYAWNTLSARKMKKLHPRQLDGRHKEHWSQSLRHSLREGLRVETSRLDVKVMLHDKLRSSLQESFDSSDRDRTKDIFKIHPRSNISEEDIRNVYQNFLGNIPGADPEDAGDRLVLFFRLASVFVSSGMSTIENEEYLRSVCSVLQLPPLSRLTLGLKEITAQFGLGPVINIQCSSFAADFDELSLLSRTQQLAKAIISERRDRGDADGDFPEDESFVDDDASTIAEQPSMRPIRVYLQVLDDLEYAHAADSYGWLLHMIAIYAASSIGPIALYGGNFDSVVVATITSVFTTLEMFVIQHYFPNMCSWIVPICSFTTGLLSPILWQGLTDYFDSAQW